MQKIIISVVLGALVFGVYKVGTRNATPTVTINTSIEEGVQVDNNQVVNES